MATTMEPDTQTPVRPSTPASRPAASARPKSSRRTVFIIMGVILLGLVIFGARKWWFGRSHVSTDNAQVDGHIVPVLPKVGGYVAEVRVAENQSVKAGDTLVVLDDRDYRSRLARSGRAAAFLHARDRALERRRLEESGGARPAGAGGPAVDDRRPARGCVGDGEPEGDGNGRRDARRLRGHHRGCVQGRAFPRARREPVARDGGEVLAAAA